MSEYIFSSLSAQHGALARKEISAEELLNAYLARVREIDKELRAYITVCEGEARAAARKADARIQSGDAGGVLAGIPAAVKDTILMSGVRATAASMSLREYVAPYSATAVERLDAEGAVYIGKTNCDEFAMGSSTENSAFFPTKNPWDKSRVPGGSSGGSAAAVAAGLCGYSLGSDTGGSIRQPAAFCGVVGLKPTYGSVSRYGLMAMASSLDQIGPLARTVEDAAFVFRAIAGPDPRDPSSMKSPRDPGSAGISLEGEPMRIGVPKEYFQEGLDPRIQESVARALSLLEKEGHLVEEVSLPYLQYALAMYYIVQPAEVSANMARYDGVRYGSSSSPQGKSLNEWYVQNRTEGLGKEVRRRIMLGTFVLSSGYHDAYYKKANDVRYLLRENFKRVFENVDILIGPSTPTLPFCFGEKSENPLEMYLSDVYTVAQNLAGVPALSVPCGVVDGLPVGMQIIGKWWKEDDIFRIGHQYEQLRGPFPTPPEDV